MRRGFAYDVYQRLATVTDSLNRQISITYADTNPYDQVTMKGFGGATRTIKVYQTQLRNAFRSDFTELNYSQLFPELNGAGSPGYARRQRRGTPKWKAISVLTRSYHYFYGSARASFGQTPTQYPGWKDGREYQATEYAANGTTPLRQVTKTFAQRAVVSWWSGGADQEPPNDPRLIETDTTLMDTNQVSKQTFGYDDAVPFNNRNNVKQYDFGSGTAGALVRETRTTYVSWP